MKELRLLCAEDEQGRTCWVTAFRLFKVARGVCIALSHTHTHLSWLAMCSAKMSSDHCCPVPPQYGILLYQNYKIPQQRKTLLSHFSAPVVSSYNPYSNDFITVTFFFSPAMFVSLLVSLQRSVSENSLVAMDFSGRIGRVIDNPVEAQSAAMEEGHAWRVRRPLCYSSPC